MTEKWINIIGYEGKYQISNKGNVKSIYMNGKELILKHVLAGPKNKLYWNVSLGRGNTFKIHRLLAIHFIPNPDNKPCINHIDGDKLNNDLSNLEWCTYKENNKHAWDNRLQKGRLVLNTETGIYYDLMKEAAKAHNLTYKNLHRYLNGTRPNFTPLVSV